MPTTGRARSPCVVLLVLSCAGAARPPATSRPTPVLPSYGGAAIPDAPADRAGAFPARTVFGGVYEAGACLSNARLTLAPAGQGSSREPVRHMATNARGEFVFVDVPPGRYHLRATWGKRFAVKEEVVDVLPDRPLDVSLLLVRDVPWDCICECMRNGGGCCGCPPNLSPECTIEPAPKGRCR
jgi:hypothetical protein